MNIKDYSIQNILDNEWLTHALYVTSERALPSIIDGMKPSQRYVLYSTLKNAKNDFVKVDNIASSVSSYGYAHGATSAASALQLMIAEWYSTLPIIKGRGSFGSRLVQVPASPRYVYAKIHENFNVLFKDIDLAPEHQDPEIEIPSYYIPVLPYVLLNNTSGMATGFSCNIFARNIDDVKKAVAEYIKTGEIKTKIRYAFPDYKGSIECDDNEVGRIVMTGVYEELSKTELLITEVPYFNGKSRFDREGYVEVLDKLEDNGDISSYQDLCDKSGFKFKVKLKRGTDLDKESIEKMFKLKSSAVENITVILENGRPKTFNSAEELIKEFCDFRMKFLSKRISKNINNLKSSNRWLNIKGQFIVSILNDKIVFKNKNKKEVIEQTKEIINNVTDDECNKLLSINIVSLTKDVIEELKKEINENTKQLDFWNKTSEKEQFLLDIENLTV